MLGSLERDNQQERLVNFILERRGAMSILKELWREAVRVFKEDMADLKEFLDLPRVRTYLMIKFAIVTAIVIFGLGWVLIFGPGQQ